MFFTSYIYGYGIQDNTIHLAAAIQTIKTITMPLKGAVIYVFTDHEENGCRGSSAISADLLKIVGLKNKLVLIALESNNNKVSMGHRGKYSSEIRSRGDTPYNLFLKFYVYLKNISDYVYKIKPISILGHTSGTSTYGIIEDTSFFAKLDFRTSDAFAPENISDFIEKQDTKKVQKIRLNIYKKIILKITNMLISIESNSKILHPSNFNPRHDESVLPYLYCLISYLSLNKVVVDKIIWGEKTKQNSIPITAKIFGDFTERIDDIRKYHKSIIGKNIILDLSVVNNINFHTENSQFTNHVLSPDDNFSTSISKNLSVVNYMTDIAKLHSLLKKKSNNVYGFVYGIGNPLNLHNLESININEANKLPEKISFLITKSLEVSKKKIFVIAPDSYSGNAFNSTLLQNGYNTKLYLAKTAPRVVFNKISKDSQVQKDLAESLLVAYNQGYSNIVIACNTLQFWLKKSLKLLPKKIIKYLNIKTTFDALEKRYNNKNDILILGTNVTARNIKKFNTLYSIGRNDLQQLTQEIIWRVKALGGNDISTAPDNIYKIKSKIQLNKQVSSLYKGLNEIGYKKIVLACTELPIAFKDYISNKNTNLEFIDPASLIHF